MMLETIVGFIILFIVLAISVRAAHDYYVDNTKEIDKVDKLFEAIGMGLIALFLSGFAGFIVFWFISFTIYMGDDGLKFFYSLLVLETIVAAIPAIPISIIRKRNYWVVLWIQTKSLWLTMLGFVALASVFTGFFLPGLIFYGGVVSAIPSIVQFLIFIAIYGGISL